MTPKNSRSGARRSLLKIGRPTLSLHIEELVLHGFASIDGDRIGQATQRELARLFVRHGVPRSLASGATVDLLDAGTLEMASASTPEPIGTKLARAIYGALSEENQNPAPRRGKPQIPQVSRMTETKGFGAIRRKNAPETKM
jgi:hypothetical protein